nr:retrovirus-related Pol polyprotein from transposon TNT 1-94 [Tanacetum cinerariifolium]
LSSIYLVLKVELQLGKKIKALRSNRSGEYLSQEFKDYRRYPKETMGYYFYFSPENKVIDARPERTTRAPNRLCLNIEVEDDEVGDFGKPANYKAAMLDPDKVIWIDYEETFSPIAYIRDIRILIAIATYYDYEI